MITNADNYMLLKQLLVILQTLRLNGKVAMGEGQREVSVESTVDSISRTIAQIETDFTIPYVLIRDVPVAMDVSVYIRPLNELSGLVAMEDNTREAVVNISTPDALNRCIVQYPIMRPTIELHERNEQAQQVWESSRAKVGELISATSYALQRIQCWAESPDSKTLEQLILTTNVIELVDRTFAYLNDYYGAESRDS